MVGADVVDGVVRVVVTGGLVAGLVRGGSVVEAGGVCEWPEPPLVATNTMTTTAITTTAATAMAIHLFRPLFRGR